MKNFTGSIHSYNFERHYVIHDTYSTKNMFMQITTALPTDGDKFSKVCNTLWTRQENMALMET